MKTRKLDNPNSLDAILQSLDRKELVRIIKEEAEMDERVESKIIAKYSVSDLTKSEYKKIVSSALNRAMSRGFIPYNASSSACTGAESVLEKAQENLKAGNIAQALTAAQAVLEKMVPTLQHADDSGGNIGSCITTSLEIFQDTSKRKLDEKTRKDFFNYLVKEWDNEQYNGWDWGLQLLELVQKFPERISAYEKILLPIYPGKVIMMVADNLRKQADDSSARNEYWKLCNYGLKHLFEINGRDKALELIEEFRQKYPHRPAMLDEINKFMKKHE